MPRFDQRPLAFGQQILNRFQDLSNRNGFLYLITRTVRAYSINGLPDSAAALAYFGLFSIFPLLLALIAVFAFVVGTESAQETVINYLAGQLPVARELIAANIDVAVQSRGVIGFISLLILLWSATGFFSALTTAINKAWGFPNDRFFVWQKLVEIGLSLAVGAALALSLFTTTVLQFLAVSTGIAPITAQLRSSFAAQIALGLTPLLVDFIVFIVLFRVLPTRKIHFSDIWLPSLVGILLFEILKNLFGWYITTFTQYQLVFGSLATLVAFLFWIYLSTLIVLITAQMAAIYAKLRIKKD